MNATRQTLPIRLFTLSSTACLALGLAFAVGSLEAAGELDIGFNPNLDGPIRNYVGVHSLAVQADGKVLIGGDSFTVGGVERNGIARLNADGSLDTGFNPNADGSVYSLAVQADGKVLIAGLLFTPVGGVEVERYCVARLNADGSLDTGFNPNADTNLNGLLSSLAVQADGKVLIGGRFTTLGGVARNSIARLNFDGSLDTGFNPNANDWVYGLALQADGKVLIGGDFTAVGGVARNGIARLNADGSLDTGFNPNVGGTLGWVGVGSLAVQADGKVLIGGVFDTVGGVARNNIARLNADGSLDTGFNPNADNSVYSLAVQADGKVLLGGEFTTMGGVARNRIARLNADGSLDIGFNPNVGQNPYGNSSVDSLAVQADGKVLIGGDFTIVGGVARNYVARLYPAGSIGADPKPDLSIGADPTAATGEGVYPPTAQSIALLSRRGAPVTLFAKVANKGLLPDAMRLRGSSGDKFFAVSYSSGGGNVTAQIIAGSFATPVLRQDDSPVTLTVSVSPNKRLLKKKVKKGKRRLTTYRRKTHSGLIEATAADDPTRSDTVRYQVTTRP